MDDAAELCRLNSAPGMTQAEFAEGLKGELAGGARFVALTRDTVIGTATVTLLGGGRWGIDGVWVKPLYRHQGLGRSLCAAILDHVKTRKGEAVTLSVNRRAWAALALYREMGFHVVESSGDESTMEKRL